MLGYRRPLHALKVLHKMSVSNLCGLRKVQRGQLLGRARDVLGSAAMVLSHAWRLDSASRTAVASSKERKEGKRKRKEKRKNKFFLIST